MTLVSAPNGCRSSHPRRMHTKNCSPHQYAASASPTAAQALRRARRLANETTTTAASARRVASHVASSAGSRMPAVEGLSAGNWTLTTTTIRPLSRARGSRAQRRQVSASGSRFGIDSLEVFPEAWTDLAGVLSGSNKTTGSPIEKLADSIGREVYIDVSGWHLYLKDVRVDKVPLNLGVATLVIKKYYGSGREDVERACEESLDEINVKLGGGRLKSMLSALIPSRCVDDLKRCVDDFIKDEM